MAENSPNRPFTSHESISPSVVDGCDAVQKEPVRKSRESVFKLVNVSMNPSDCVVTAFQSDRISYVPTVIPKNNFLKLCRFAASGTLIGTTSADNSARIFGLTDGKKLSLKAKIPLGDAIYDMKWFSVKAEREIVATTAKHHPIHLWCEYGARYATYRGINHLDELAAAYSIEFSSDGTRLYAGYNSCIRIWETDRPGRQHTSIKTWGFFLYNFNEAVMLQISHPPDCTAVVTVYKTLQMKNKNTGGQKSIVSCITMNNAFPGVYAVGTYDGNVGFYSDRTNSLECMFPSESTGITDIHYSYDGKLLFVALRKKNEILCYDMRMPGSLLYNMIRRFTTNQRTCFEIDSAARYLFSGTSDGELVVFDLGTEANMKFPVFSRKVADCSVPCVSIHEGEQPMVTLCTGERVFPLPCLEISSSSDTGSESDETSYCERRYDDDLNNSLQLWCF